jgi:ABC-type nitrate/sulfonate/bicarbonate transport system substrate-binding protein
MTGRGLLIPLLLALLLSGSADAQEKKLESLIVSYSSFTGNRAPFWIAKELGLYEKYGLAVDLVNIAAGSVSLTALLAGNVHLTTDSSAGVVSAGARGAPVVTVPPTARCPTSSLPFPRSNPPENSGERSLAAAASAPARIFSSGESLPSSA